MSNAITPASLALFLAYARDAGNWAGTPLVGGNVGGSAEDRGNLTQLKRAGLIETWVDRGVWIKFTKAGHTLATAHGVTIDPDDPPETMSKGELLGQALIEDAERTQKEYDESLATQEPQG